MEYTTIDSQFREQYEKKMYDAPGFRPNWAKIKTLSAKDPSIFAKWYLGITPYDYQDQVLNDTSSRIIVCSSRQIGKTYVVVIKALHYAIFHPNSKVLVFSKSGRQSKKFMRQMKEIMFDGIRHMHSIIDKQNYNIEEKPPLFPVDIDGKKPDNQEEFSLTNGSTIYSLPPTDSSRGQTGDLVIVDEAAFVPDDIFDLIIEPTVRHTGGTIILLSTPNGQKGFFFRYFDPADDKDHHAYARYWWNWEICPEPNVKKQTEEKKLDLMPVEPLKFHQEYEAQFTTDADAFFNAKKVEAGTDHNLDIQVQDHESDITCGIDYGETKSRTVVTLVRFDQELMLVHPIYQREFPSGYDNSRLSSFLDDLEVHFKIKGYVVDDCPGGDVVNRQLENKGKVVYRFNFTKEKLNAYYKFRAGLYRADNDKEFNHVRIPFIPQLIAQINAMQMAENKMGYYSISKPVGGNDDRVDSLVMACYPYLNEEKKKFRGSYLI